MAEVASTPELAHLRSKAVLGYFPMPPRVVAAIARHLAPSAGGGQRVVRLLDPCAGEGLAATTLARALGATAYGIELHPGRAERARASLDHVLAADALGGVKVAQGAFSLLLLNPPYDDAAKAERLRRGPSAHDDAGSGPGCSGESGRARLGATTAFAYHCPGHQQA